uniref:Cell division protein FtsQ n=1 Tax=uncultured Flavobacteriia bacterium TaxID=212695 RepID=H6RFV6_9BACT|nr:cell division protein FtsQ [uncultured Flavobacteriia bacterium]
MLYGFVNQNPKLEICKGPEVKIDHKNNNHFVDEEDVRSLISKLGYHLEGQSLAEIDLKLIEKELRENPSVLKAQVYTTVDCALKVDIEERNPIARIYNKNGTGFYLDEDGRLMPLSNKFTARVLVLTGDLNLNYSNLLGAGEEVQGDLAFVNSIYALSSFIHSDPFWRAQIAQVQVTSEKNLFLIPKVGKQQIEFGKASGFKQKFENLRILYVEGFSKTGWNEYSTINLKYENQVICSK